MDSSKRELDTGLLCDVQMKEILLDDDRGRSKCQVLSCLFADDFLFTVS